jgi:hypothetical protein
MGLVSSITDEANKMPLIETLPIRRGGWGGGVGGVGGAPQLCVLPRRPATGCVSASH